MSRLAKLFVVPVLSSLLASVCASQTRIGAGLNELSYATTQHRLARAARGPLEVSVIDISGLPRQAPVAGSEPDPGCYRFRHCVTDRDSLLALIRTVAQRGPAAIGIDIDFSPDSGWVDPVRDPWFLSSLIELRDSFSVPIYVVAGRTSAGDSSSWLGVREFAPLAATATRSPTDPRAPFTMWQTSPPARATLCSMPVLLTNRCDHARSRRLPFNLFPTSKPFEHCTRDGTCIEGREYYVDYSRLRDIELNTRSAWRAEHIQAAKLSGQIVLLGYAAAEAAIDDRVAVPGRHDDVPGVLAIAAATQTLLDGGLRVPGALAGVVMDVLFAAAILVAVQVSTRRLRRRNKTLEIDARRVNTVQQLAWPIVFGALGFVFVSQTRIVWADFLVSVPILMFFLWAEPRLPDAWKRINERFVKDARPRRRSRARARARIVVVLLLPAASTLHAQTSRDTAAVVLKNNCAASVRTASGTAIKAAAAKYALRHGEWIRCTRPGSFELSLRRTRTTIDTVTVGADRGWYVALAPARALSRSARQASTLRPMVAQPRGVLEFDALRGALHAARLNGLRVALQNEVGSAHATVARLRAELDLYVGGQVVDDAGSADVVLHVAPAASSGDLVISIIDPSMPLPISMVTVAPGDSAALAETHDWVMLVARNRWLQHIAALADPVLGLRIDRVSTARKSASDAADAWYADCKTLASAADVTSESQIAATDDLLGFRAANSTTRNRYYYVLHLGNDGRLTLLSPANSAGAMITPSSQRCLTVAQTGSTQQDEIFFVFSAESRLSSIQELLGLTVPAWLVDTKPVEHAERAPLAARALRVITGDQQ